MDIELLLTQPESKILEFKQDLSSLKPILKTIVAFANTAGGTLIVGYSPEKGVIGIPDFLRAEESLTSAIYDSIFPDMQPEIDIKSIGGKSLLIIRVAHQRGPFFLKSEGSTEGVYMRFGSSSRKAGLEFLADITRHTGNLSFDQLPCANLKPDDLDSNRIANFMKQINKTGDEMSFLKTLGILTAVSKRLVPSNGGIILFGTNEAREHYFPDACISCARFKGVDKSQFIDRQDIDGSIIEAIEPTLKFIMRNTRLGGIIRSLKREDIQEYPEVPLREVLLNAIAHGNYSISGRIFVSIFDDRLEIQSPGMLPYGMTLEDFKSGISHIRNRVIARVLRELGLIEEWGSGYNRITTYCQEYGYPLPEWQEFGAAVRVTFRPHSSFEEAIISVIEQPTERFQHLTQRQEEIISILAHEDALKSEDILAKLKYKPASRTLRDDLLSLKHKGFIDTKGSARSTVWFLVRTPPHQ